MNDTLRAVIVTAIYRVARNFGGSFKFRGNIFSQIQISDFFMDLTFKCKVLEYSNKKI